MNKNKFRASARPTWNWELSQRVHCCTTFSTC